MTVELLRLINRNVSQCGFGIDVVKYLVHTSLLSYWKLNRDL